MSARDGVLFLKDNAGFASLAALGLTTLVVAAVGLVGVLADDEGLRKLRANRGGSEALHARIHALADSGARGMHELRETLEHHISQWHLSRPADVEWSSRPASIAEGIARNTDRAVDEVRSLVAKRVPSWAASSTREEEAGSSASAGSAAGYRSASPRNLPEDQAKRTDEGEAGALADGGSEPKRPEGRTGDDEEHPRPAPKADDDGAKDDDGVDGPAGSPPVKPSGDEIVPEGAKDAGGAGSGGADGERPPTGPGTGGAQAPPEVPVLPEHPAPPADRPLSQTMT